MLLIIFLGLFAKLTWVSGDCDVGSRNVTNFYFPTATGTWYVFYHSNNSFENGFECFKLHFGCPDGNISFTTVQAVDKSTKTPVTVYGNATNWNSNGCFDEYFGPSVLWTSRFCFLAYEYDSYLIVQLHSTVSNEQHFYVMFRCKYPDEYTMKEAKEKLECYNIDINQMVNWWPGTCHHEVSSTE